MNGCAAVGAPASGGCVVFGTWVLLVIILLVLLIPLAAIFVDSELGKALARRLEPARVDGSVEERLYSLEEEMEYVSEAVRSIQAKLRSMESPPES